MSINNRQNTVLVVDDDPDSRRALVRTLQRESLAVECMDRGADVACFIETQRPDLVILDVILPDADGIEICRDMKQREATRLIPIILVTGLQATEDHVRGLEAGADDLLTKPFERSMLLARVRALLRYKRYVDRLDTAEAIVLTLARSIEGRDPYTGGHCERLAVFSARIGEQLGLDGENIQALRIGGIVHDIGKVTVPDGILNKNGPLTPEERAIIERHPVVGEQICRGLRSFGSVLPIIRHHHEKQDGTGYPDGLSGSAVPITARILQVTDVFDALTTQRPYRGPLTSEDALGVLKGETDKGWWDPEVVSVFTDLVKKEASLTT